MFEPLAAGSVAHIAALAHASGVAFGFGGIARLEEGLLSGRDVLAEHLRLGSGAVILSRTFLRGGDGARFEDEVAALRVAEAALQQRTPRQAQGDSERIAGAIRSITAVMAQAA
jgi:hypothetical protein